MVEGSQSGRRWWEQLPVLAQLTVLDQRFCLLPQPGCLHLGLFQKLPWKERGKEEQEELLSTVRGFSTLCPKPASAWLWKLQALDFTATIASWVEWDEHHSSPQSETGPKEEGPAIREGVEWNLGQTPGP